MRDRWWAQVTTELHRAAAPVGTFRWTMWVRRRLRTLRTWRVVGPPEVLQALAGVLGGEIQGNSLVTDSDAVRVEVEAVEPCGEGVRLLLRVAAAPDLGVFVFKSTLPSVVRAARGARPGTPALLVLPSDRHQWPALVI